MALFLLFGAFSFSILSPSKAEASFLSSILGGQALADTSPSDNNRSDQNSQTLALLQANVSSISILQDKGSPADNSDNQNSVDSNNGINIVSDDAMLPSTGPLSASGGEDITGSSSQDTSVYVVRNGDTLSGIAKMFGVSVNTILSANDMKKGDKLSEGDVLFILPISGIEHAVAKGETLQSIAKLYKVDVNDILFYNGISTDDKLNIGDKIVIPGADLMADEGGDKPAPNLGSSVSRDENYYATHLIQDIVGYFINPLPTGHKTQGLHGPGHRAIDIGAPTGTPILASAGGTVLIARTGWSGGYGNMAIIEHPNGTKTLYAHMSKLDTHTGDEVFQGEVIGYVGSTGRSTGPHLHFEVFNAKNPGADWSWKQ